MRRPPRHKLADIAGSAMLAAAPVALLMRSRDARASTRIDELRRSRARIVESGDEDRRRLERALHEGAQQRLHAAELSLRVARERLASDPEAAARLIDASMRELAEATAELRDLARGIHPAVLDRGLALALQALAARAAVPVEIAAVPDRRLSPAVEAAAYQIVSEALAGAAAARVSVRVAGRRLVVEVTDGEGAQAGRGLPLVADRVAALDGRLWVLDAPGGGSTVRAELPVAA